MKVIEVHSVVSEAYATPTLAASDHVVNPAADLLARDSHNPEITSITRSTLM
jgi:hypothetical protein